MRRRGARLDVAPEFVLPGQHPAPQHAGVDPQRVAHGIEAECMSAFCASRDPSSGIDKKQTLARISRQDTPLIDVDRVGQQREHQALLAGQAMATGNVKELAGENLVQADEALDRGIESQLKAFRQLPSPPGFSVLGSASGWLPTGLSSNAMRRSPLLFSTIEPGNWFPLPIFLDYPDRSQRGRRSRL